jgi:hypothetical protein
MSYAVVKNGGLLGFGLWGLGAFTGNATIKPGSTNVTLVKQLQTFLGVKADGSFGPNTTTAVAAFQKAHGLTPDGTVGPATWAAMDAAQASGQGGAVTPGAAPPKPCPAGTHFTGMTPDGAQLCEQDAATPTVGVGPGQMIDTGPGPTSPGGGATAPAGGAAPGALAKAKNWWGAQTTTTKGMVVGGAVLGVVLLSMLFGGGPAPAREPYTGTTQSTATPNRRRRRKKAMKKNGRRRAKRRGGRSPKGHRLAPAKYRRMGATSPGDYAYPAGFMYPIRFHKGRKVKRRTTIKHIRAAASRFGKFSRRYPPRIRKQIRARIAKAERQYHIGRYR